MGGIFFFLHEVRGFGWELDIGSTLTPHQLIDPQFRHAL